LANIEKYSRQILFAGVGREGQERLLNSRVTVIGCGALGAMQIETLARAGVGHLRVVDRDFVEESNLQRQIMFEEQDVADKLPKAIAVEQRVRRINSDIDIEAIVADVNYTNVEEIIEPSDLVIDGTDNFETRFLLNDACVKHSKPWIYGAAVGAYGLTITIRPYMTPCLRCIFETMPPPGTSPTCDTAGVILPIISMIASIQATEAIKILTGQFEKLHGSIVHIDVWENLYNKMKLGKAIDRVDCATCKRRNFEYLNARTGQLATSLCGRNSVQITHTDRVRIDLGELAERLRQSGEVTLTKFLLKFKVGDYELTVFPDARSIIKGTDDIPLARGLYAKYVGV